MKSRIVGLDKRCGIVVDSSYPWDNATAGEGKRFSKSAEEMQGLDTERTEERQAVRDMEQYWKDTGDLDTECVDLEGERAEVEDTMLYLEATGGG